MSGSGVETRRAGLSPSSERPSPRSGSRIRSPNSRYAVDLGYDNVPQRSRRMESLGRRGGSGESPIALDLSGSVDAEDEEGLDSSMLSVEDDDVGGRGRGGKRTARGGPRASSTTAATGGRKGANKNGSEGGNQDEEEAETTGTKRRRGASSGSGTKSKKRLCSRPGEWQLVHMIVTEVLPAGVRNNQERRDAWTEVANRLKEPQTLECINAGKTTWARVDYSAGRKPEEYEDSEALGRSIQRQWGERAKEAEKEEKNLGKKTGEGTMEADQPSTLLEEDSEKYHLLQSMMYQDNAREQRKDDVTVPKEQKKAASDTRDMAAAVAVGGAFGRGSGGGRGTSARGEGAANRGGRAGGGRGTSGRGTGAAAGGMVAGAGGRGSSARDRRGARGGRGNVTGAPGRSAAGSGSTSRRTSRGRSHHHHNSGGMPEWELDRFFAPPPSTASEGGNGNSGGGSETTEPLTEEGEEAPGAEAVSLEDEEAQALSAGLRGRQTRTARGGGGARRQVFRGDPAAGGQGDLADTIGSALQLMRERQLNPPAAGVGAYVDPRVTALEAGLRQNNEGLAATTKVAQEGLDVAKQTLEMLGQISAGFGARPPPAAPAPPFPPPFAYWNGHGGFAPATAPNGAAQNGAHGGGGLVPPLSSAPVGAWRSPPQMPSFAGAGVSEAGGAGAVSAGARAAGGRVDGAAQAAAAVAAGTGVAGAGAAGDGAAGAGAAGARVAGAGVAGAGVVGGGVPEARAAGAGVVGGGAAGAGAAGAGVVGETGAVAPLSRGSTVSRGVAQEATVGAGRGSGATQDAGGRGGGGQEMPGRSTATGGVGGRGAGKGRAVGVNAPTYTNPNRWNY